MDYILVGNCSSVSFTSIALVGTFEGLPLDGSLLDHRRWMLIKPHRRESRGENALLGRFDLKTNVSGTVAFASPSEQGNRLQNNSVSSTQLSFSDSLNSTQNGEVGVDLVMDGTPNSATFASLLRRYGKDKALLNGRRLHAYISKYGRDRGTFLGNCLVQMYGNCGSVNDAQAAFEKIINPNLYSWNILISVYVQNGSLHEANNIFSSMPQRDVVSWNAMIAAFGQSSHGKQALELFRQMQLKGVKPDIVTFISVLDACASMAALEEGQQVHATVVKSGFVQDIVVGNILIHMYGKCGNLHKARNVFGCMPQQNVATWNAMITAYDKNGHEREALELFCCMHAEGIQGDRITFLCVLDACASLAAVDTGQKLHAVIVDSEYEADVSVGNGLIYMYGKCNSLHDARSVFNRLSQRNVISWSVMISAYTQSGLSRDALQLFSQMQLEGVKPDKITFISVLDACVRLSALKEGQQIHTMVVDNGYEHDVTVGNSLVNLCGKCGSMDNARSMFYRMPQWDLFSWCTMIAACTQNGNNKEALELFCQMQLAGEKPDKIAFVCVLESCASLAALEEGQELHAAVVCSGYDQDLFIGTALINLYGKCGQLDDAQILLGRIARRDVVSWSALIASYAQNGCGNEALELFCQMQLEGIKPDKITFVCVLTACSHTGSVDDGWRYFVSMYQDYHIKPTVDHYICMIDLLSRSGHLDEAEILIKNMPFEGVFMAWLTLLGACRIHGDVQRGVHAANRCFELDPKNSSPYIVMSNIYAKAGMWDAVAKLREALQNSGVESQPERSCIAINKVVYELIGDVPHPQNKEIYAELNRLSRQIKGAEHVPDTQTIYLHEQERKGLKLCYHTEKRAIALGLISTPSGTPLRITKNLCVCSDCHIDIKSISKIVQRKLIIRDAVCFHQFEHGLCSCRDCW